MSQLSSSAVCIALLAHLRRFHIADLTADGAALYS